MAGTLATGHDELVGVDGQALDVVRVAGVVALALLLHVEQHHHRRHEVHDLASRKQVQVAAAVLAPTIKGKDLTELQVFPEKQALLTIKFACTIST